MPGIVHLSGYSDSIPTGVSREQRDDAFRIISNANGQDGYLERGSIATALFDMIIYVSEERSTCGSAQCCH